MNKLEGKTALVTGGTSGIGGGSCLTFAREGATVISLARDEERGRAFEAEAREQGLDVHFYACNVGNRQQVREVHERIKAEVGEIDILMNNAGVLRTGALEEITDEDWDAVYQTNVKTVLYMCQEYIEELSARQGVILNNASIDGLYSYVRGRKSYMYASSKAALIKITQLLAKNYAPVVRVNCLCPGFAITNLFTNRTI